MTQCITCYIRDYTRTQTPNKETQCIECILNSAEFDVYTFFESIKLISAARWNPAWLLDRDIMPVYRFNNKLYVSDQWKTITIPDKFDSTAYQHDRLSFLSLSAPIHTNTNCTYLGGIIIHL